jgi:hypothetical protein
VALVLAYRALLGPRADDAMEEALRRVVRALPEGGGIIHLSVMSARVPCAVKLYGVVPQAALEAFLQSVGWRGPFGALRVLLRDVATAEVCGPDVYFDLNLTNMGRSDACTLGVAFSQQQIAGALSPPDIARRSLLARLEARRQCTALQAAALAAWPSASVAGELGGWRRASRWLDVKAVIDHAGEVQSKAYLGFNVSRHPFAFGG